MNQKSKILLIVLIFGFIAYIFIYQNIINERASLDDEHCIKVNPLIIKRKNLYIDSMRAMFAGKSKSVYENLNAKYVEAVNQYLVEESKWLEKDSKALGNPLVKMLVLESGYKSAEIGHQIYELDLINTKNILKLLNEKSPDKQKNLSNYISINGRELDDLYKDYDEVVASSPKDYRWVDYLIRVPKTSCPAENYNFPDVNGELNKML